MPSETPSSFAELGLSKPLLKAIDDVGYEAPSAIQAEAIPPLLAGRDLVGQAQTGSGKTAAFALPLLSRLNITHKRPQVLVLTPTRELAIQVAEAMQSYARRLKGFRVLPVYGGQSIETQLRQLRRGVHVVVGTPGRIQDHLRRRTLALDSLSTVVLDEADEMLRMGFIEDVEAILDHTPDEKQVALFSATMPPPIRRVAKKYLRDPVSIEIETKTATVDTVEQRYWRVAGVHKLDALTRILEVEDFDAMLVFVRTKIATTELADRLEARGFASAALNGDMNQALRERTVERLKSGRLDILVATDVAARGLDVERISHVINFDIPYDVEAYVHRIGRTARAGRHGKAILFVSPRERRMLYAIERVTRQQIEPMRLPSREDIADRRVTQFKQLITETLETQDLDFFNKVIDSYQREQDVDLPQVASALAYLVQRERPLRTPRTFRTPRDSSSTSSASHGSPHRSESRRPPRHGDRHDERHVRRDAAHREDRHRGERYRDDRYREDRHRDERHRDERSREEGKPRRREHSDIPMVRYRIEVGRSHGVQPGNIVGAISNEAELDGQHIGHITLYDNFSLVELPDGMPRETYKHLQSV
ncbi:MAG: DEAD/DEAH box helicase, partial [Acidobacteriota bacterium]